MATTVDQYGVQATVEGFNSFIKNVGSMAENATKLGQSMISAGNSANRINAPLTKLASTLPRIYIAPASVASIKDMATALGRVEKAMIGIEGAGGGLDVLKSFVSFFKRFGKDTQVVEQISANIKTFASATKVMTPAIQGLVSALAGLTISDSTIKGIGSLTNLIRNLTKLMASAGTDVQKFEVIMGRLTNLFQKVNSPGAGLSAMFRNLGQAAVKSTSPLTGLGNLFSSIGKGITNLTSPITNLFSGVTNVGRAASSSSGGMSFFQRTLSGVLSTALGFLSANVFSRIAQQIGEIVGAAFNAAASFQTLTVRLEGLAARQFRAQDSTLSVADSMAMATEAAQGYLRWVKEIALTTPFGTNDIAKLFTLAQAYDFTAEEAKTLTTSIVDFASGMGLTETEMIRIIENFGQMRAAGKVTGTELKDLARGAFVPVNDVIRKMAENLGIASEDFEKFRDDVASGVVPVDEFFNAFNQLAETDFSGAAARMSRTWTGVTERVRDFIQTVIGVEVLGPLLQRFTNVAADALDVLTSPEVRKAGTLFGLALANSFDQIWASLTTKLIPALQQLAGAFGINIPTIQTVIGWIAAFTSVVTGVIDTLANFISTVGVDFVGSIQDFAAQAWGWGENIIAQLANGIVEGGGNLLQQAMQYIGQILAYWLQPHSPPEVAKDILKWGAGTFEEYLKGFSDADFGVLNDLQSPLKSALDVLTQLDVFSKGQSAGLFADISENIAAAIEQFKNTGEINTNVFAGLDGEAAAFGDELQALLEDELKYAQAVDAVTAAQEALNAAQAAQKQAQGQVKSLTMEYNSLLRAGADESVLRAKLAEINAAEQARNLATDQAHAAQEALDASKDALGPLKDQIDAQKELIAQLLELARIQAGATEPAASGGGSGGGGGGGGGGTGGFGGGFTPPPLDPDILNFDEFFAELQQKFADGFAGLVATVSGFIAQLVAGWQGLWQSWLDAITGSPLFQAFANVWNSMWQLVQTVWPLIEQFVSGGWQTLLALWEEHAPRIRELWNRTWNTLGNIVSDVFIFVNGEIATRLDEINRFFEEHKPEFSQIIDDFWYLVYTWADFWLNQTETFLGNRLTALGNLWEMAKANILPKVSTLFASISNIVGTIMGYVVDLVASALASLRTWWEEHGKSVEIVVSTLLDALGKAWDFGLLAIGFVISKGLDYVQGYWDYFSTILINVVDMLVEDLKGIWNAGLDFVGAFFDIWAAIFTKNWEGLWDGIKDYFSSLLTLIGEIFSGALEFVIGILALWIANVIAIFVGLWNTLVGHSIIPDMLAEIQTAFETVLTAIATWIDTNFIQPALTAWQTFMDNLKLTVTNIQTSFVTAFENLFNGIKTAIETIWGNIKDAFDTFLESKLMQSILDFYDDFKTAGKTLIDKLIEGIVAKGSALYLALKTFILDQINAVLAALGLPPLGGGSGDTTTPKPADLRVDPTTLDQQAQDALATFRGRVEAPMVIHNTTINFNTTINSGMDAAEYRTLVRQTVDRML